MTTENFGRALDRASFFAAVRSSLFGGRLSQSQVEGMDALLDAAPADMPLEHLAYCLATAYHETGQTMQPVVENLRYTSAERIRAVWPSRFPTVASARPYVNNPQKLAEKVYGNRLGNDTPFEGWLYRGRSYVQLTGEDNYERAEKVLGIELTDDPDVVLNPQISSQILYAGMAEGWFTGKKLADYFRSGLEDPYNARRIINGLDRAAEIAEYYRKFLVALKGAQREAPVAEAPIPPPPDIEPIETPAPSAAALAAMSALVAALVAVAALLGIDSKTLKEMIR